MGSVKTWNLWNLLSPKLKHGNIVTPDRLAKTADHGIMLPWLRHKVLLQSSCIRSKIAENGKIRSGLNSNIWNLSGFDSQKSWTYSELSASFCICSSGLGDSPSLGWVVECPGSARGTSGPQRNWCLKMWDSMDFHMKNHLPSIIIHLSNSFSKMISSSSLLHFHSTLLVVLSLSFCTPRSRLCWLRKLRSASVPRYSPLFDLWCDPPWYCESKP